MKQNTNNRGKSEKWANWMSELSSTTCQFCAEQHGKIQDISILKGKDKKRVNAHPYGRCIRVRMRTVKVETATDLGPFGADAYLLFLHKLPRNYVDKRTARLAGWKKKGQKLSDVLPGKVIGGDIYHNDDMKLPDKANRIWYEADINYTKGTRNTERIIYSNDGLIFVTYDHYYTFYELTK